MIFYIIYATQWQNFDLKKGIIEQISYEHRAHESVDDESLF